MQLPQSIRFIFFWKIMMLAYQAGTAQEYIYKHYSSKDGLANSTVYQMLQDKDGFIWFATSSGLSRFDGLRFKNFSIADGLPVNVIVRMFEDSRGRIWLMPFANALCYYYQGKIYNQQNDPLLRKIQPEDYVRDVVENKHKDLLLTDAKNLYHIDAQDHVKLLRRQESPLPMVNKLGVDESGEFNVCFGNRIFSTDTKTFRYLQNLENTKNPLHFAVRNDMSCWINFNTLYVQLPRQKKIYKQYIGPVNTMYLLNDSILCLNTTKGTIFFNVAQQKVEKQFLSNGNVSHFLIDKEGGYWFSTLNDGVFQLSSPVFNIIAGQTAAGQKLGVYHLEKFDNHIWAGCDLGHIIKIGSNNTTRLVQLTVEGEGFSGQSVYSLSANENRLAAACGNFVYLKGQGDRFIHLEAAGSSKEMAWKNDRELIVASSNCLYSMPVYGTAKKVMHKMGRINCLLYRNDSTWFGTFDGLSLMKPDGQIIYLGKDIPQLSMPIVSLREGLDGTIWVAGHGSGLVGLRNNKITWHFGSHNGLSDRVRCIGVDSGSIWAGTEKDLNKISLQPDAVIKQYSYADELNSSIVNTLLIDKNIVYAGTPGGIIWFDKRDTLSSSLCNLKMLGITVNGHEREWQPRYFLPYKNNNIRFDYTAISMKSAGDMVYRYRLTGLDTAWKTTTQTSLDLISLPPGEYKLELFAVNRLNVKSSPYSVDIVVQNPFWRTTWFMVSALVLASMIAWFIGTQHNRSIIRKQKLRALAEQRLLELEQKARRAQMNPHFIFNCLQSIQSFILDKDPKLANKYLSQFASLIRQTLENSLHSFIPLSDEIRYLNTYLQLEQMRSESKFAFTIEAEATLSTASVSIPVMVIQPFVENAVRHGVQLINDRTGHISVYFSIAGNELVCQVKDNGIGRQRAQLIRSAESPAYRSLGMQLTYERIALINTNSAKKINVEIIDKFNELNEPYGTDVIIRFPIFTVKDTPLS